MIPVHDIIPTRTVPLAAATLAAAQILVVANLAVDADLVHALANAACLWIFGSTVEDRMGGGRFALFVMLCGVSGVVASRVLALDAPPLVMAVIGGVAGVVGGYFVLYPESRLVTLVPIPFALRVVEIPAVVLPCLWFLLQFAFGPGPAAVAALAAGAALVRLFRRAERMRGEWWNVTPQR